MDSSSILGSMPGTVYILQSLTNSRYYIGSTNNLTRRLAEHNSHKSKFTAKYTPYILVFSQKFPSLHLARLIEIKIKSHKNTAIIKKIIKSKNIDINKI